ncbi:MAG: tRNA (N6-threonylcarbamoyladenosine(37)-N6)-methyltransferase TrmO [Thermoplasmata archaeon]|nr:MAG: tRNA (N6-threonylcarbamoyladenosine(37)-N6)-methyltransferase TrmO [Thermoplasmata archaeon]
MEIIYKPIGIIHTPFKDMAPIQPIFSDEKGVVEIYEEYREGLKDLEEFSHIILVYHFHLSKPYKLHAKPYLSDELKGIFAIRSPNRPNPIGISVVKLERIDGTKIFVRNVDILDRTPLLDIKPYVPEFDCMEATSGWLTGKIKR